MAEEPLENGKLDIKEEIIKKLNEELNSFSNISPLLPRSTQSLDSDASDGSDKQKFRIMQWNILAQGLSLIGKFVLCPQTVFQFERRMRYIVLELLRYDADVICLEEVDMFEQLNEYLSQVGYCGTFIEKCPSPCLAFSDNIGPDGCAIFYKYQRLKCVSSSSFRLGHDTTQVALVQLLQSIEDPETQFYVTVTHLKAKPQFSAVRKVQGDFLLAKLDEICRKEQSQILPIFVCCDMNADPHEEAVSAFKSHNLKFSSTYAQIHSNENEPEFTTWKFRGADGEGTLENRHTIDYMWYQKLSSVKPLSIVSIPTEDIIGSEGLPCAAFPSDHMSLIADFSINH